MIAVPRPFDCVDAVAVLDAFADPEMARQGDVIELHQAAAWISATPANRTDRHVFAIDVDGIAVGAVGVTFIGSSQTRV